VEVKAAAIGHKITGCYLSQLNGLTSPLSTSPMPRT